MSPKASSVRARMVSIGCQLFDKVLVGKEGGLFEAVHAFFDSYVDITIRADETVQIVLFAYGFGEILVFDSHKFRVFHWRS